MSIRANVYASKIVREFVVRCVHLLKQPPAGGRGVRCPKRGRRSVEGLSEERVAGEEHDDERHDNADEGWVGDIVSYCTVHVAACACPTCRRGCQQRSFDNTKCIKERRKLSLSNVCPCKCTLRASVRRIPDKDDAKQRVSVATITEISMPVLTLSSRCAHATDRTPQGSVRRDGVPSSRSVTPSRQSGPRGRRGSGLLNNPHKPPRNVFTRNSTHLIVGCTMRASTARI